MPQQLEQSAVKNANSCMCSCPLTLTNSLPLVISTSLSRFTYAYRRAHQISNHIVLRVVLAGMALRIEEVYSITMIAACLNSKLTSQCRTINPTLESERRSLVYPKHE